MTTEHRQPFGTSALQPRRSCLRAGMGIGLAGLRGGPVAIATLAGLVGTPPGSAREATLAWPALDLLDGGRLEPADWADTAAVLVFWATWCGFCTVHNGHLETLHRRIGGRGLRVLGACVDGQDPDRVRAHVRRHGWTFPVTLQAAELRRQVTSRRLVPLTVVVDRRGRWREPIPGQMAESDVLELAEVARAG